MITFCLRFESIAHFERYALGTRAQQLLGIPEYDDRSAAGVELWADRLGGAVLAIGNAPTALFRLLELIDDGVPAPAAVLGGPVGFVGSAQSKEELISDPRGMEYLVVTGRRGGSAMAAAAVNAVASSRE